MCRLCVCTWTFSNDVNTPRVIRPRTELKGAGLLKQNFMTQCSFSMILQNVSVKLTFKTNDKRTCILRVLVAYEGQGRDGSYVSRAPLRPLRVSYRPEVRYQALQIEPKLIKDLKGVFSTKKDCTRTCSFQRPACQPLVIMICNPTQ